MRNIHEEIKNLLYENNVHADQKIEGLVDDIVSIISKNQPDYLTHPMTIAEIKKNMDEDNYVTGRILFEFDNAVGTDLESFLDEMAEALVGNACLMDIDYSVVGVVPEENSLILEVSGDVTSVLEMDDPEWYEK